MAHDHRMNEVGEPHLNKVNRMGRGQSDLRRLSGMIANNLEEKTMAETVFLPDYAQAVESRLSNYRQDRNDSRQYNEPMGELAEDTAREVSNRFKNRHKGGDGSYAY